MVQNNELIKMECKVYSWYYLMSRMGVHNLRIFIRLEESELIKKYELVYRKNLYKVYFPPHIMS